MMDSHVCLIQNACIVLPDKVLPNRNLLVKDGKIADLNFGGNLFNRKDQMSESVDIDGTVIDAAGGYVLPGFIDVHVHGGGGVDFMDATAESFETAVKTHLQHGTTMLLPTAMTASEEDLAGFIQAYQKFKKESPYACITPGVHLEGPYFSGANAKSSGAQPGNLLRLPQEREIRHLLELAEGAILRWDAAPELEGADMFARLMKENGVLCAMAHTNADSEQAQRGIDNGFSHVTHFYNAVTTYHKVNQNVYGGVVEAAYLNSGVTVELICDGKHIPRDILKLALKIKGAHSVSAITDAMRLAGTDSCSGKLGSLKNGTDVIVDDGVAKLPDLSSFAGSIATMDRCLQVLCIDYGISVSDASVMLSKAPAKLLALEDRKGSIVVGLDADLVITDRKFQIQHVLKAGLGCF